MSNLLTTQLCNFHVEKKSKLLNLLKDMLFSYDGTLKEHNCVRNNCAFLIIHIRLVLDIDQYSCKIICSIF